MPIWLLSAGSSLLGLAKRIPWYAAVIAALTLLLWLSHRHGQHEAELVTKARGDAANWRAANAVNYASVGVLLKAVNASNASVEGFRADAARATAAANAYDAKAQAAAADRAAAIAALKAAGPVRGDVPAPDAHNRARGLL